MAILSGGLALAMGAEDKMDASAIDIGGRKQFWFNAQALVADTSNIRILQQRPVKHPRNPLLVADRPWEGALV